MKNRLLSRRVVIRNLSNATVFGAVVLTSVLYMAAIIGCAARHRQPIPQKILYLAIPRYASHFLELIWVGKVVIAWDRDRTFRWSTRLYGEGVSVDVWHKVSQVLLSPHCVTVIIPLCIGCIFLSLYSVHGWVWAKWYGVIGFTEIGVRLTFTWLVLWFLYSNLEHLGMAKEDLSDLPEDMTNYSRRWSDNNKNTWVARQKRKRKNEI